MENSRRQFAVLPYMKGVMEYLQWAFKKHDIRYSKAGYAVSNTMVSPKDPLNMCE